MADAPASGAGARKGVGVQIPSSAPGLRSDVEPSQRRFVPRWRLEIHKVVPSSTVFSRFGARSADVCIDGILGPGFDCVPVDPYGWTGETTACDAQTGLASSGDPYYCLTGVTNVMLWQ